MKRICVALTVALLALLATGCFDIEQSIVLDRDLSGKAGFRLTIDFEPMITTMLTMQRSMEGKKDPPSAEEIAKAKQDFLAQSKSDWSEHVAEQKTAFTKDLPQGLELLDATAKQDGLKMTTNLVFHFTDPSKLAEIDLRKKGTTDSPMKGDVINKPFDGLVIERKGKNVVITSKPADPMKGVMDQKATAGAPDNPELEAMTMSALKGLRVAYRIEAPFQVIETNATRREGKTLIWEYTLDSFQKLSKDDPSKLRVYVRYRDK